MISLDLVHVIALCFLFIAIFGASEYRASAIIISIASIINIILYNLTLGSTYIQALELAIKIDVLSVFFLCLVIKFNSASLKQSVLLAFAVFAHIVLLYDLTKSSNAFTNLIYMYYDELIIAVGILQIMATYNGFITALSGLREYLLRISFYCHCHSQSIFLHIKNKARA